MLVQWVICHFKRHQIDRHKQSSFFAANPLRSALPRGGGTQTFFVSGQLPIPLHLTHCSYSVQLF